MRALFLMALVAVAGCGPSGADLAGVKADYCWAEANRSKSQRAAVEALMELEAAKIEGDPEKVRTRVMHHEFAKKSEEQSETLYQLVTDRARKLGLRLSDIHCESDD